jgi:adiponectin receptor
MYFLYLNQRRPTSASYLNSAISTLRLHTETVNIWSHIFGTVWFSVSAIQFSASHEGMLVQNEFVIPLYLASAAVCFMCSTLYHVFADHIHASSWQRLDHCGIIIFIWASSVSFVFLSFNGERVLQWLYFTMVNLGATTSLVYLWGMSHSHPRGRRHRIATHIGFGGSATLPALHYMYYCLRLNYDTSLLKAFLSLVVINSIGGGIYATGLVGNVSRNWLDMPGISHNIMHGMVLYGAWIYQSGLSSMHGKLQ